MAGALRLHLLILHALGAAERPGKGLRLALLCCELDPSAGVQVGEVLDSLRRAEGRAWSAFIGEAGRARDQVEEASPSNAQGSTPHNTST